MERSANFISRNIRVWKGLSHEQVEECIRDVQVQMLEDLFNEGRGCEFWEVRFWLCLKRRILNLVRKYRVLAEMELNPTPIPDDEGHLTNYFERQAAPSTLAPEQSVQVTEALALLSEQERVAFVLYYYEEWPQQEIATHLKVTDRTVRNLLGRASKRLETWRNAQN